MSTEREYTPPITLGAGYVEIDTTPDGEGDLEVYSRDGDHVAYLDPTDQMTLRDLLNRLHPQEPQQAATLRELNALPPFSVIHIPHLRKTLERLSDGWYEAALVNTFTAYETWLPATVLHVGGAE